MGGGFWRRPSRNRIPPPPPYWLLTKTRTMSLVSKLSARPDPNGERPIYPILHDPEHLADVVGWQNVMRPTRTRDGGRRGRGGSALGQRVAYAVVAAVGRQYSIRDRQGVQIAPPGLVGRHFATPRPTRSGGQCRAAAGAAGSVHRPPAGGAGRDSPGRDLDVAAGATGSPSGTAGTRTTCAHPPLKRVSEPCERAIRRPDQIFVPHRVSEPRERGIRRPDQIFVPHRSCRRQPISKTRAALP